MKNWNPKIPLNFFTGLYAFLMGSVLSYPVHLIPTRQLVELPDDFIEIYPVYFGICVFTLPLWGIVAVAKYTPLCRLSVAVYMLAILWPILFPAITSM